ncbi:hypothetical protein FB451DRAFT_367367 [Mycena latifolia]|nr:hypothetical protein FB451DRAFT_367367 [Mycena latifolia]
MHRGLRIPEIVRLIFEETQGFRKTGPELRVLAALSQTCTTFLEPALDLLWGEQDTLLHLLDTFPHDLIHIMRNEIFIRLLRPVSAADSERPLFYSRRMKSLSLRTWPVSPTVFETLSLSFPGGYMFPNLQVLNMTDYPPQFVSSIDFLISPQLQEICLYFGTDSRLLGQIVPMLSVKCPSLTCVDITVDDSSDAWTLQLVSDFIRSSSRIEILIVPNLDPDAFKHLGGLTSLTGLKLEDPKVPWTLALPFDTATSPQPMYSSLTELYFGHTTVDRITAFIKVISNPPLKKLEADSLDDAATSDVIGRLYSALAAHCSHDSLQDISMHGAFLSESASPDQYRIHGATLRTLFCFGNMVSVDLHQCSGFDLDDADIFDMACAWPRLEYLSLTGATDLELREPRVTVQGFYAFAHHCPNLGVLEMIVNATVPPELPIGIPVSQASLRTLDVYHSPIRTPKAVAAFLASIFPEVDVNSHFDGEVDPASEEGKYSKCWEEVKQSLLEFRAQKNQEKRGEES